MEPKDIDRFVELLKKWKHYSLTWGECCELMDLKYSFGDAIQAYWDDWK